LKNVTYTACNLTATNLEL